MKFTSRKFLLCVAIILGSIATAIAGFNADNTTLIIVGVICGAISTALYTICETVIDVESIESETEKEYIIEEKDEQEG